MVLLLIVLVVEFRTSCDDDEMADELEELKIVVLELLFSLLVLPPTLLHAGDSSCIPATWKPIGGGRFGIPGGGCVGFSSTAGFRL